ncbi:MFS transporter [Marinithermofilum abyssi]|uniref:MFS transporter n=1 Tax=Marinithermofilum abyssi TaxID=1571185 RepID=A0A8J2YA08_9BACL|nr:MFS transporter [Marinithermofilum abyssi]GGE03711.1 MFS transporter [Marinithermofilum abyssi]
MSSSLSNLFRNRVIRAILLSALFLQVGIWVRNFSILLFVMEKTDGDPFAVSMISVAEFAPIFIFSFIGGTFADRWRPKRTMIGADLLSAASIFAVLVTLLFFSWKAVFFATLFSSILSQFSQPSGMKLFKMHVPADQIQMGMSMYQTTFALFMVLGPVLGTFVYQSFGIDAAIGVTGVAFLLSAAMLYFLPPDRELKGDKKKTTLRQEMADGIRYVLSKRELTLLGACFVSAGLAIGIIQPLNIFLVTERLASPKEFLQWFMAANGLGMVLGGVVAMGISKAIAPQKMLMLGMLVSALGMSVSGISTLPWLTLIAQFVMGLVMPFIHVGINTMVLQHTKESFVGRVNGILSPLFTGAMVLMMTVAGALKKLFSIVALFEVAALLFIIGLTFILPLYRQAVKEVPTMPEAP